MSDTPEQAQLELQTPGELLKLAREEKQLSQDEVAQRLNLKLDIITSLEGDLYEQIAAPTYTKGYIRSYARILGLDAQELIDLFDKTQGENTNPEILPKVSKHGQISSSDKPVKLITYLITLSLFLLFLIWWQGKLPLDTSSLFSQNNNDEIIEEHSSNSGFDYDFPVINHPTDPHFRADVDGSDYAEIPLTAVDEDILVDESINITTAVTAPAIDQESTIIESNSTDTNIADESRNSNNTKSDLTILVEEESWIEIHDGNNNRLFLDLAQAGRIINVSGPKPYSLLLGNAEGLRVQYEGQNYDLAPHTRSGVARLKLGE